MNNFIITESSSNIRLLARQALDGKWKMATLAFIIYVACITVPVIILEVIFGSLNPEALAAAVYETEELTSGSMISSISSLYAFLVTGAFTLGMTIFFLQLIRQKTTDLGHIFSGFGYYFKTLGLYFMISLFITLWMLLLIVPGIIASLRYSQAFYILADDPTKGVMQCIRESKELMKGNKGKIFCLQCSFIPWMLLAILPFVIIAVAGGIVSVAVPVLGVIIMILGILVYLVVLCVVSTYMMSAETIFYEMVTGRLRAANSIPPTECESYDPWQQ